MTASPSTYAVYGHCASGYTELWYTTASLEEAERLGRKILDEYPVVLLDSGRVDSEGGGVVWVEIFGPGIEESVGIERTLVSPPATDEPECPADHDPSAWAAGYGIPLADPEADDRAVFLNGKPKVKPVREPKAPLGLLTKTLREQKEAPVLQPLADPEADDRVEAPLYSRPAGERWNTKTAQREIRRDIRRTLGTSNEAPPSLGLVLLAARELARLVDITSDGRYGLAVYRFADGEHESANQTIEREKQLTAEYVERVRLQLAEGR